MEQRPVLELLDVAVAAGGRMLLKGISLRLAPGELVAIQGPSGCGKTTLLRAVAGLIDTEAGAVRLRGEAPATMGWPSYRRQVLYLQQLPALGERSVSEALRRPFAFGAARRAPFPEERARSVLAALGLGAIQGAQGVPSLSVGERQRVALARGLLVDPAALLLDEPTSALDEESTAFVEYAVRLAARRAGMAALIITHNQEQASRWCDRVVEVGAFVPPGGLPAPAGAAERMPGLDSEDRR